MPLTKTQADGINLADTFAFTGTVSGAGDVTTSTAITKGSASINVLGGLNKVWWHIDSSGGSPTIDDSFNVSSAVDDTGYTQVNLANTMESNKWTCVMNCEELEAVMSIFSSFETTTACYYRSYYPRLQSYAEPDDVGGILTGDLA